MVGDGVRSPLDVLMTDLTRVLHVLVDRDVEPLVCPEGKYNVRESNVKLNEL